MCFVLSPWKACFVYASSLGLCAEPPLGVFGSVVTGDFFGWVGGLGGYFSAGSHRLKQLLSFAIGGLLGNVFLHLLPEAWAYTCSATTGMKALCAWKRSMLCPLIEFFSPFHLGSARRLV